MISIRKLSEHIGADIEGVSLGDVVGSKDKDNVSAIRNALNQHLVVRFRGQSLTAGQLVDLASLFGPVRALKRATATDVSHIDGHPQIKVVSNVVNSDGKSIGDGGSAENSWHTDGTYLCQPTELTFLYGREAPKVSPPKTYFMSMISVYGRLPDALTEKLKNLWSVHYSPFNFAPEFADEIQALPAGSDRRHIGPIYPMVRTNPYDGRLSLFLPRQRQCLIKGLSYDESEKLSDLLWTYIEGSTCVWGASIEPDDLFLFDNRFTLHRREPFDAAERRILWHVTTDGTPPVPAAQLSLAS